MTYRACGGIVTLASVVLVLGVAAAPARAEGVVVINDFDGVASGHVISYDDATSVEPGDAGGHVLRVTPGKGPEAKPGLLVRFTGVKVPAQGHFRCTLKVASAKPDVTVRWVARRDAQSPPLRQAKLTIRPDAGWVRADVPMHEWRWGNDSVGDLSEAGELVLLADESVDELRVDDVRVETLAKDDPAPVEWLRHLAFGERESRLVQRGGVLVATDVPADLLPDANVDALVVNIVRSRAFVKRVFGDAVRPVNDGTPPALLIFRDPAAMTAFWERLGEAWGATIHPPREGGYSVCDIATSSYDARVGPDRPVYLHEAVHAVVAHDVRLLPGTNHAWLQEGVANYVQLCVYPRSLNAGAYARAFAVSPGRPRSPFQPIKVALGPSRDLRLHGQRATIFGYLLHEKPHWLPVIARSLAEGADATEALRRCETTMDALGAEWLKWGDKWFAARDPEDGVHFPLPSEWTTDAGTDGRVPPAR